MYSVKGVEGLDVAWIDEAERITEKGWELLEPTIRKPGSEIWCSLNPTLPTDFVYDRFVAKQPEAGAYLGRINWDANPWWSAEAELTRLRILKEDPARYAHIYGGELDPLADEVRRVTPWHVVQACVDAWERRPRLAGVLRVGVDLGLQGRRTTGVAMAVGGVFHVVDVRRPETWTLFARALLDDAQAVAERLGCPGIDFSYDAAGDQAASFKREMESALGTRDDASLVPVAFGGTVAGRDKLFEPGVSNGAVFANRAAQMAALLGQRALNTTFADVEPSLGLYVNPGVPDVGGLVRELSLPAWESTPTGKRKLDKQADSAASPHRFDAMMLALQWDTRFGFRSAKWRGGGANLDLKAKAA